MTYNNNNTNHDDEFFDSIDEAANTKILNKILHEEDSFWCMCGGRFNAECIGDVVLWCGSNKSWSIMSEKERCEWKLKNFTQSAWTEISKVESVLSSSTAWNSMSSRERYDWKNKYIKETDDWISKTLKKWAASEVEP